VNGDDSPKKEAPPVKTGPKGLASPCCGDPQAGSLERQSKKEAQEPLDAEISDIYLRRHGRELRSKGGPGKLMEPKPHPAREPAKAVLPPSYDYVSGEIYRPGVSSGFLRARGSAARGSGGGGGGAWV
jgi:hypothetical protein